MIISIKNKLNSIFDYKLLRSIVIYTFVFGLIAHGYCFLSSNFSHDSLAYTYNADLLEYIKTSRFIRPFFYLIKGRWILPWLNGTLALMFISISSYFLIDILKLKSKLSIILVCGILATNSSLTLLTATYIQDLDMNMFALMLNVIAVYLILNKYNTVSIITSLFLFIISLGIYQAYICFSISLFIIVFVREIIDGKELKDELFNVLKQFLIIALACISYFIIGKALITIMKIEQTNIYNSLNSISLSLISLKENILSIVNAVIEFIFAPSASNGGMICLVNIILIVVSIFLTIIELTNNNVSFINKVIVYFAILILPFAANITTLISGVYHALTKYPCILLYLFIIMLIDLYKSNLIFFKYITILLISLLLVDNIVYSNKTYLKKDMEFKSTLSIYTRIIDRIEQIEGYNPYTVKVYFVGNLDHNDYIEYKKDMDYNSTGMWYAYSTSYTKAVSSLINNYLSYPMNIASDNEIEEMLNKYDFIEDMPCFPDSNSIKYIDDTVIVKLSN